MADVNIVGNDFQALTRKYKDMADGTFAEVVYNGAPSAGGVAAPTDVMVALNPINYVNSATVGGANRLIAVRTFAPKSGFLRDLTIAVNVSSGNIDVGVYDTGDALAGSRTLLGHSGSIACPATLTAAKPTITWDPGAGVIPVVAGKQYEFALACDNVTATFFRMGPSIAILPDTFQVAAGGALPKLSATVISGFPLPATVTEANWLGQASTPFIMARVSVT